ncbi:MAG: Phosphoribosyltransferase [Solirubrobacteraceae bacterium]|nr:Phosphoribosyltransferase [Solirubrobacteraceae bacterium]
MGAGALPVGEHRRRPPIPIVPVDERARAAALADGLGDVAVWLAGVAGAEGPASSRLVCVGPEPGAAADGVVRIAAPVTSRDPTAGPAMTVGEVALAVDTGRELAARAAADAIAVLVGAAPATGDARAAIALAAHLTGRALADTAPDAARALALHGPQINGPLGALRRLGTGPIAVLCGVALGAGERGLGFAFHGPAAAAAAALAAGIELDLRARLIAGATPGERAAAALVAHLGVPAVLDDAGATAAAVAAALMRRDADRARDA